MNYVAPKIKAHLFTCSACGVLAQQAWASGIYVQAYHNSNYEKMPLERCICVSCHHHSYWHSDTNTQIFPRAASAPMPHIDLPTSCRDIYLEARDIAADSAKAAAALLRLCVQHLLLTLGGKGKNLDDDIAKLVAEGLPWQVRDALDICRVVGNNAVHPGEINIDDNPEIVSQLFELINFIVRETIERKKTIMAMYEKLPAGAREAIAKRDAKAITAGTALAPHSAP